MSPKVPRIPFLPRDEWTPEVRDLFSAMDEPGVKRDGTSSHLTLTMINHPALARGFYAFGKQVLLASSLPDRLREIITLYIGWRYQAEYEWSHHVAMAKRVGVTEEEIEAVKQGAAMPVWSDLERSCLRATQQLCDRARIDDQTWSEMARHFDKKQLMDFVLTVGHYVMLSLALGAFEVEAEPSVWTKEFRGDRAAQ